MVELRSPLAAAYRPGRIGVTEGSAGVAIRERRGRTLVQVSGWPASFGVQSQRLATLLGCDLPADGRRAVSQRERAIFRVGPERLWLAGPADDALLRSIDAGALGDDVVVTEIGSSRTVLRVAGEAARTLLNRGLPVDLDPLVFPLDAFAQSVVHHIPVLVHRSGDGTGGGEAFDVYVSCDYALSFWEWLIATAAAFGCEIEDAR